AFEETALDGPDGARDTLNPETGQRFRREILAVGGARPAADSFIAFRGRHANMEALLRHNGMTEQAL
ncbi:MAG TPA: M3 family metallopeptidase, partial [Paralcaligenes sp.]